MKVKFYFLFVIVSIGFSQAQSKWSIKKNENGIKVYSRIVKGSNFKEYKASTFINAPIDSIISVLTDGDNLKNWNYKTTKSALLDSVSNKEFVVYMYNDMPWPAKNRDHISSLSLHEINDTLVKINIKALPERLPLNDGVIRVVNFSGFWLLEKSEKGTLVTQQMHGDPGGLIPYYIVNTVIVDAPFDSFSRLKRIFND